MLSLVICCCLAVAYALAGTRRLSAERVVEMLRGQVDVDDLPERDEIPLESIRGDLR